MMKNCNKPNRDGEHSYNKIFPSIFNDENSSDFDNLLEDTYLFDMLYGDDDEDF